MTINLDTLRTQMRQLYIKREKGDVTEKIFQRDLAERTVELYRAVIQKRLAKDETILREHHAVRAHFRVTQSVLREPEQAALSCFATDRRLFYLQSTLIPGQPPTADRRDRTEVEELPFTRLAGVRVHRQFRLGEMGVGAVIVCLSLLLSPWLDITGPILTVLGGLGILHALLVPTRWIEIQRTEDPPEAEPILIYAVRKKSARNLVRYLRQKMTHP
jgi:hypothetical protein